MSILSEQVHHDQAGESPDSALYVQYRALNGLAVLSGVLGVLSIAALLDWTLGVIPFGGMVIGLLALRRIRSNPTEYTGENFALAGTLLSAAFLVGGWTRLGYVYATEVPEGYQRISYDTLQPDTNVKNQTVPPAALELDGKRVFIKGYVFQPTGGYVSGLKEFMLVRDRGECCFGGNPKMTDMILVRMQDGLEGTFDMRVRRLAGTFHIQPNDALNNLGSAVYQLDADFFE